jgi:hypothetical protein
MEKVTITLNIPAELARQAQQQGLLTDDMLAEWLRRELDRRARADAFFKTIDQLAALEPKLTPEDIAAEIEAHRAESD